MIPFYDLLTDSERKRFENNKEWWAERKAKEQDTLNNKGIKKTEQQLKYYYQDTMFKVIDDFENVYMKVITGVAEGKQPTPADLYKLDAYWKQQAQLAKELEKLGDKQVKWISQNFVEHHINAYKAALPAGDAFAQISKETAEQMVNTIWCADGKTWSDRIWTNTSKVRQELNQGLIDCVLTGKPTSVLKDRLKERFNVSYNRADSIVRTEYAHIQTQAAQQRYKDAGVKQVEVWADYDERRCDICGKLHKQKFPVGGQMPVPAHPRCRCRIIPVIEEQQEQLSFDI